LNPLVIGYGNPLRQDDGAGWLVIDLLTERLTDRLEKGLRLLNVHQLTPELCLDVSEASVAIFVDARDDSASANDQPVKCEPIEATTKANRSHSSTPGAVLSAARDLFQHAPPAYLVSIPGRSFGFADEVTPACRVACSEAADLIVRLIGAAK